MNAHTALLIFALFATKVFAQDWEPLANGRHSLQTLGKPGVFYIEVPMKPIPGARLVLFNHRLAKELGLEVPKDPKQLEEFILKKFAYEIDPSGQSSMKRMVTYYQDSFTKNAGDALGDGRAVWTGEFQIKGKDGIKTIDVTAKGIGKTPLAFTNHANPLHSDGLQSMHEAIHSFVTSEANRLNQIDTSMDLAVIEIPSEKLNTAIGMNTRSAITVRLGNQTRTAHWRYHRDNPKNFKKIFEYTLNRDMGRAIGAPVSADDVKNYLERFAKNLAHESAAYQDLHIVHGSPTAGNRTTQGSSIDLATFQYLDAHHKQYPYLSKQYSLQDQYKQLLEYIDEVEQCMIEAKYPHQLSQMDWFGIKTHYHAEYQQHFASMTLKRLGIPEEKLKFITKSQKKQFEMAVSKWFSLEQKDQIRLYGEKMNPAAFEPREIFKKTLAEYKRTGLEAPADRHALFNPDLSKDWHNVQSTDDLVRKTDSYVQKIQEIVESLGYTRETLPESWIQSAKETGEMRRSSNLDFRDKTERVLFDQIREGKANAAQMSQEAMKLSDSLVDKNLLPYSDNQWGRVQSTNDLEDFKIKTAQKTIVPCAVREVQKLFQLVN